MATAQGARRVLIGLILLSIALVLLVISPFFEAFFLAAVLAGAFQGLHGWLSRRFRGRSGVSAGLICLGTILALLLPLAALTAFIVSKVIEGVNFISTTVQQRGLEGLLAYVPGPFKASAAQALERFQTESAGLWQTAQEQLSARGATAAQTVGGVLTATGTMVFQGVMMLIALYFLLVEGQRLVAWMESVSPLKRGQTTELLREFRRVTRSVLVSTLATAGVQAVAALAGYLLTGVPVPIFFAAVTFFFALLGGLAVFGAIGLLLGPLSVAFFLAALRIYERDYGRSSGRPGDPPTPPRNPPTVAEGEEWEPSGLHLEEGMGERQPH